MSEPVIGARELRAGLASHLRRARDGERLVVTVDGRPIAQIGPVEPSHAPTLADLMAVGLLEPPRRSDRPEPPDANVLAAGLSTFGALQDLRGR